MFSINLYKKSDLADFRKYIRTAFDQKYILGDEKYINWQYDNGLYAARHGSDIIGHFGFRDLSYKLHDRTAAVRVLMNFFVLEKYRRSGAAIMLAEKIFDSEHPILVSGYTPLSQKLFPKFRSKWQDAGNLERYLAIFKNEHENEFHPGRLIEGLDAEKAGALWRIVRERYPVTVERTAGYLNWRFLQHPFFQYQFLSGKENGELAGYLIYRMEESEGFKIVRIIDCVAKEGFERTLFRGLLEKAWSLGANAADFMFSGNLYEPALIEAGFFKTAGTDFENFPILFSPISYKKTFINVGYDMNVSLRDFYLTKADGDQDRPNPR